MTIDYSQLQTFITCPRKYELKMIKKLRKIRYDERNIDLDFGKCIHSSLEEYYKTGNTTKALDILIKQIRKEIIEQPQIQFDSQFLIRESCAEHLVKQ